MFARFHTPEEVARLLRLDARAVMEEVHAGRLKALKCGNQWRIPRSALQEFQQSQGISAILPRRIGALALAGGLILACAGLVLAQGFRFPFPMWQEQAIEIGPQEALFRDDQRVDEISDTWHPVNAPLDYRRFNDAPNPEGTGLTHMLMSLQQRNELPPGSWSFPWTQFVSLDTNHDFGDGLGTSIRLDNRGAGWASAQHVDALAWGTGTTIGSNIETIDAGGHGAFVVGANVQNKGFRGNVGMQVQTGPFPWTHPLWQPGMDGGWDVGFRLQGMEGAGFYGTGIELGPRTHGQRGMWIRGNYTIGIDLGANDLSMRSGSRVELSRQDQVAMRFNAGRNRIEFLQGNEVIGYLDASQRGLNLGR